MRPGPALAVGCVALLGAAVGCSPSEKPAPSTGRGQATVTFGAHDAGPVTGVVCAVDGDATTIVIAADQPTRLVLTDENPPQVDSVGIGEIGSDQPALTYRNGTGDTASLTRDGKRYTVTGTGMGTDAMNATTPVETSFAITATCP